MIGDSLATVFLISVCLFFHSGSCNETDSSADYNLYQDHRLSELHRKRSAQIVELEETCNSEGTVIEFVREYEKCVENSIGMDYFRNEYLSEMVFEYIIDGVCEQRNNYSVCLDTFYASLKSNCLNTTSTNIITSIGSEGLQKGLEYVCKDGGKKLIAAYTRGDEKCVKQQQLRIQECVQLVDLVWSISVGLILEPVFYFDEFMCRNYAKFEQCILNDWVECDNANNSKPYTEELLAAIKEPVKCTDEKNPEKPDLSFEQRLHHHQQILACPLIDISREFGDLFAACMKREGVNFVEFLRGSFEEFENETLPNLKLKYCPHTDKAFKCLDMYFEQVSTCLDNDETHFGRLGLRPIKAVVNFICTDDDENLQNLLSTEGQLCFDQYRSNFMTCSSEWEQSWRRKMPFFVPSYVYIDSEVKSELTTFKACLVENYSKCNSELGLMASKLLAVAETAIAINL